MIRGTPEEKVDSVKNKKQCIRFTIDVFVNVYAMNTYTFVRPKFLMWCWFCKMTKLKQVWIQDITCFTIVADNVNIKSTASKWQRVVLHPRTASDVPEDANTDSLLWIGHCVLKPVAAKDWRVSNTNIPPGWKFCKKMLFIFLLFSNENVRWR